MIREIREISKTLTSMEGGNRQELKVPTWPHCCGQLVYTLHHTMLPWLLLPNHALSWGIYLTNHIGMCQSALVNKHAKLLPSRLEAHIPRTLSSLPQYIQKSCTGPWNGAKKHEWLSLQN